MLSMFGRGEDARPVAARNAASLQPPANTNGREPGLVSSSRARLFEHPPTRGQYLYHLAADMRAFTRAEIHGAVVGATPVEVQRLARLAAKLKGRYLAQALDLAAPGHGPIVEADVRFLERARFMYEEVERALDNLRQSIETGDLALEGLRKD